jgi:predicted RNA-binding Zn ribbon-like protein
MVTAMPHLAPDNGLPRLLGGMLCLDFVNTVDPRHAANRSEYLTSYDMLARWAGQAGAVAPGIARDLQRAGASRPGPARGVLDAAIELREHLYQVIRPLLDGDPSPGPSLDALSAAVARAHDARQLVPAPGPSLAWSWRDAEQLDLPLLAVALSAADLVTGKAITRVRECPGADGCGWLFLDTSKSGTRRWCSMQVCGNRAKVHRYRTP